jgi:hypothetical protein
LISGTEWFVIFAGAAAIAWVNWYVFIAGRRTMQVDSTSPAA